MKYISEKRYNDEMRHIQNQNISKERRRKLREEKNKSKRKMKLPTTSKLVLFGMIIICLEIVLFVEYATMKLCDTSALYALIGIPVAISPTIWGYYSKSKAENTEGGIIYETTMREFETKSQEKNDSDSAVG